MEKIDKKNDRSQLAAIKFLKKPSFFWENFRTLYGNLNKLSQEVDSKNNDSLVGETYKNYPPRELQASGFFLFLFFSGLKQLFLSSYIYIYMWKPTKISFNYKEPCLLLLLSRELIQISTEEFPEKNRNFNPDCIIC